MLAGFGVSVPLGQAEIDYVDDVLFLSMADEEVVRLHIPVYKVIVVKEF